MILALLGFQLLAAALPSRFGFGDERRDETETKARNTSTHLRAANKWFRELRFNVPKAAS